MRRACRVSNLQCILNVTIRRRVRLLCMATWKGYIYRQNNDRLVGCMAAKGSILIRTLKKKKRKTCNTMEPRNAASHEEKILKNKTIKEVGRHGD